MACYYWCTSGHDSKSFSSYCNIYNDNGKFKSFLIISDTDSI